MQRAISTANALKKMQSATEPQAAAPAAPLPNVTNVTKAGAKINYPNGFVAATTRNITNIRAKATDIAASGPGVSSAAIAAQFEGASTAKAAIAHRDWLMKTMPQAAPALARAFSDAEVHSIWKH